MTESGVEFEADNRSNGTLAKFSNLRTNSFSSNNHTDDSSRQHNNAKVGGHTRYC